MKIFLIYFTAILLAITPAHGVMIKPGGTTEKTVERITVSNDQVSKLADKKYLIETGDKNLLVNKSFEAVLPTSTTVTGWTLGTNVTPSLTTSNVFDGSKALRLKVKEDNSAKEFMYQMVTTTQNYNGQPMEASIRFTPGSVVSAPNARVYFCVLVNGISADGGCTKAETFASLSQTATTVFTIPFIGKNAASYYFTGYVEADSTGINREWNFDLDDAYLGPNRNIGTYTPPGEFSAKISSTGVVTLPTGDVAISASAPTDTSLFALTWPTLQSPPTCVVIPIHNDPSVAITAIMASAETTSGVVIRTGYSTTSSSFTKLPYPFRIKCNKTGADAPQTIVATQNQDSTDRIFFTPTVSGLGAGSGSFTPANWNYYTTTGINANICYRFVKDATAGTGSSTVSFSLPPGVTVDSATAAAIGSVFTNATGAAPANLELSSGSIVITTASGGKIVGSGMPANSVISGCITIPTTSKKPTNGAVIVNALTVDPNVSAQGVGGYNTTFSGTTSVIVTAGTNVASVTSPATCTYSRNGYVVTGGCRIANTCTAGSGTQSQIIVTPPVNTTAGTTISGTFGSVVLGEVGRVVSSGNNFAVDFFCQQTANSVRTINFSYSTQ